MSKPDSVVLVVDNDPSVRRRSNFHQKAAKAIRNTVRSWKLPTCSDKAIEDRSRLYNPIIRGWLQYYGRFYRTALHSITRQLDRELVFWAKRKYKKLRRHPRRARHWIASISR